MLCFIAACARPGTDPSDNQKNNPTADNASPQAAPPKDQNPENQSSAFLLSDSALAIPTLGCKQPIADARFPDMPPHLTLDGKLDEWTSRQTLFVQGELTSEHFEVSNIFGGIDDQSVVLAVGIVKPLTGFLYLEFGGSRIFNNATYLERTLSLRTDGKQLQEFTANGDWQPVAQNLYRIVASPTGIEILMSRRYLGEAVNWPVWWLRLYDPTSPSYHSQSSTRFFGKALQGNLDEIQLSSCEDWGFKTSGNIFFDELDFFAASGDKQKLDKDQKDLTLQSIRASFGAIANLPIPTATAKKRHRIFITPYPLNNSKFLDSEGKVPFDYYTINPQNIFNTSVLPAQKIFVDVIPYALRQLIRLHELDAAPTSISDLMAEAIKPSLIKAYVGDRYYYENWFDGFSDPLAQKNRSVGYMLSETFQTKDLFTTLNHLFDAAGPVDLNLLSETLMEFKPESLRDPSLIFHGWFDSQDFTPAFAPAMLADPDYDGVPTFLELKMGTNPNQADTDNDGWSDFAELIAHSDSKNDNSTPKGIVADGDFGDFLKLMPKLINFDKNFNASCPKTLDITHFAALVYKSTLIVGAATSGIGAPEPAGRWEISIVDQRSHRQFTLKHNTSARQFTLTEANTTSDKNLTVNAPYSVSGSGAEWQIDLSWLGLPPVENNTTASLSLQMRTVMQNGAVLQACDETDAFAPIFASGVQ